MNNLVEDNQSLQDVPAFHEAGLITPNHLLGNGNVSIIQSFGEHLKVYIQKANRAILLDIVCLFYFWHRGDYTIVKPLNIQSPLVEIIKHGQ